MLRTRQLLQASRLYFAAPAVASKHQTKHIGDQVHPTFYINDFEPTSIEELEFIRSPFHELASLKHLQEGEDATTLLTSVSQKLAMTDISRNTLRTPKPTKTNLAFTRYADQALNKEYAFQFQFSRGQPL